MKAASSIQLSLCWLWIDISIVGSEDVGFVFGVNSQPCAGLFFSFIWLCEMFQLYGMFEAFLVYFRHCYTPCVLGCST